MKDVEIALLLALCGVAGCLLNCVRIFMVDSACTVRKGLGQPNLDIEEHQLCQTCGRYLGLGTTSDNSIGTTQGIVELHSRIRGREDGQPGQLLIPG